MMRHQFLRTSFPAGTRVELELPEEHPAYELHGMGGVVLRCLGCSEEDYAPEIVDYLVKIDGNDSIIVVSSDWIVK